MFFDIPKLLTFIVAQIVLQVIIFAAASFITGIRISTLGLVLLVLAILVPYFALPMPYAAIISCLVYFWILPKVSDTESYVDVIILTLVVQILSLFTMTRQLKLFIFSP